MKQKVNRKIKKLLIDAMAFLKVEAYTGVYEACEQIADIIDNYEESDIDYDKMIYGS